MSFNGKVKHNTIVCDGEDFDYDDGGEYNPVATARFEDGVLVLSSRTKKDGKEVSSQSRRWINEDGDLVNEVTFSICRFHVLQQLACVTVFPFSAVKTHALLPTDETTMRRVFKKMEDPGGASKHK